MNFLCTELYNTSTPAQYLPITGHRNMHFCRLWNGRFDPHRAEIAVMQFTGHSLPVHQFVTVPWDFNPVPYCQPSSPTPTEYRTSAVFGMACLAGSEVNILQCHMEGLGKYILRERLILKYAKRNNLTYARTSVHTHIHTHTNAITCTYLNSQESSWHMANVLNSDILVSEFEPQSQLLRPVSNK